MLQLKQIKELVRPAVEALGHELWGCDYIPQGKYSVLRVYIDGANGVTLDDCSEVSRQVAAVLDVEDIIKGKYNLEVSSPGIDRQLYELAQFHRYIGQEIKLKLHAAIEGKRNMKCDLLDVVEDELKILVDKQELHVPFASVAKANLVEKI